jgi:hypothetical protein
MCVRRDAGAAVFARGGLMLLVTSLFVGAGCGDLQAPTPDASATLLDGRYAGGVLEFRLQSATGGPTSLALVATGLEFDPTTEELRALVSVRNGGERAALGPASIVVSGFVPEGVVALNAACDDSPGSGGGCSYDYRGAYGGDGVLEIGESSAPVEWRLRVPGGQSFAFRAQLGATPAATGKISGSVFEDRDGDGARDADEVGVAGARVRLRSTLGSHDTRTDAAGRYAFGVDAPGIYAVEVTPRDGWRVTTAQPLQVTILRTADGSLSSFALGDMGVARLTAGPAITVEGFAFLDLDRDGQRDAGEPGIASVKIKGSACPRDDDDDKVADDDDGDNEASVRTDTLGHYSLVLPGCGGPWEVRGSSVGDHDRTTRKTIRFTAAPAPGASLQADFGYIPEESTTPDDPDTPDGPDTPDDPDTPDTPDNPGDPDDVKLAPGPLSARSAAQPGRITPPAATPHERSRGS